nr:DMT family transporter [Ruegeria atlantica]
MACTSDYRPPYTTILGVGLFRTRWFFFAFVAAVQTKSIRAFISVPTKTLIWVSAGLIGNNAFYLAAISRVGPAEANVIHYLWPVLFVVLVSALQQRSTTWRQKLGISCGFIGVAIALYPHMDGNLSLTGVLFGFCGALTFAIYSVGRSIEKMGTDVIGPSLGLAGFGALSAHVVLEPAHLLTTQQWIAVTLIGIGPFTIANMFWDQATRKGSAATISSLAFLTPLVAIGLLSILGLNAFTLATLVGALFTVVGALVSSASE